jgi:hypothetical protein
MPSFAVKKTATLQAVLLFFIVSHPMVYKFTDTLLGGVVGSTADISGRPTTVGLLIHSAVFGGIIWSLMQ